MRFAGGVWLVKVALNAGLLVFLLVYHVCVAGWGSQMTDRRLDNGYNLWPVLGLSGLDDAVIIDRQPT